jgi:DNA-binding NtrC family response regulator
VKIVGALVARVDASVMDDRTTTLSDDAKIRAAPAVEAQPFLYVVLCSDQPSAPSSRHALGNVDEVQIRRGSTRAHVRLTEAGKRRLILMLPDRWMSSDHARLIHEPDGLWLEDLGSKNGTFVAGKRVRSARIDADTLLEIGHSFLLIKTAVVSPGAAAPDVLSTALDAPTPLLATLSPPLARSFSLLGDVARSSIPILIGGESGTGKEVVARAVHELSGRHGPFVAVNCGALPAALVEAELFGFRKGAFSGAHEDRAGLIRSAHGGTLFLDEIGDLPLPAQAALLRVLQEREVLALGSVKPVAVDLRIVSATHRELEAAVHKGTFRSDLLSRLLGFRLRLPALRDRREDLGLLAARLFERSDVNAERVTFAVEAARALLSRSWPGNVRELEHRLRLAAVLAKGEVIEADHLFGPEVEPANAALVEATAAPFVPSSWRAALRPEDVVRREQLARLLQQHGGNVSAVARAMGKARVQIQRWIKRYRLDS